MRFILYVSFDGFYVAALHASTPECALRALVVHRERVVLDACPEARARGVRPGLALKAAKAILSCAAFVPWEPEPYALARTRWLDRLVPYADAIEPDDAHGAWVDLSGHPRPDEVARRLLDDLRPLGPNLRGAAAPAKWVAKLLAESGLTLDDAPDWRACLLGMPVEALRPLTLEQRARLTFLGCQRVSDVAWIGIEQLRAQFGKDGLRVHQAARGLLHEPVAHAYPPGVLRDAVTFESATDSLEQLATALGVMADRMGRLLGDEDVAGHTLEAWVLFERPEGPLIKRWTRTFIRPIFDARALRVALRRLLDRRLDAPVEAVRVLLGDLRAASRAQADLFRGLQLGAREQALFEVAARFGRDRVRAASQVPASRAQRVLAAWRDATGWVG